MLSECVCVCVCVCVGLFVCVHVCMSMDLLGLGSDLNKLIDWLNVPPQTTRHHAGLAGSARCSTTSYGSCSFYFTSSVGKPAIVAACCMQNFAATIAHETTESCTPMHAVNHLLTPWRNSVYMREQGHFYHLLEYSTNFIRNLLLTVVYRGL